MAAASAPAPEPAAATPHAPEPPKPKPKWQTYGTPVLVVLLAAAVVLTITRNWNAWEGGRIEQVTDDAYVRGDLTPLGTKISGIVRDVKVSDYQEVHKGDLIVALDDDDYRAQVAQAIAAVEAAKAAIENNVRQRELQDAKIDKALAGIDQARAQITAAQAGIDAAQAEVVRSKAERTRQEALLQHGPPRSKRLNRRWQTRRGLRRSWRAARLTWKRRKLNYAAMSFRRRRNAVPRPSWNRKRGSSWRISTGRRLRSPMHK